MRSRPRPVLARALLALALALALALSCGLVSIVGCAGPEPEGKAPPSDAGGSGGRAEAGGPGATALRLIFRPEVITKEADVGLDQLGTLRVQVFDSSSPPAEDGALYDNVVPSASGEEIALSALPELTVPLPDPPSTVYVRAVFVDNAAPAAGGSGAVSWGTWLGGIDLSSGFTQAAGLTPVRLTLGSVTRQEVPLLALRRVTVTVTTTAVPIGDGEGSLSVAASRVEVLPPRAATYGYGIEPCVDLHAGPQVVDIQVVGSGTFFVAGFFDDLGIVTPGQMPPGTMLTVRDVDLGTGEATFDRLVLAPDQYSATLSIALGYVAPLPADAGTPGPNSCADLGY